MTKMVKDVMSPALRSIRPESSLLDAARLMIACDAEALAVVDGERLLGMIGLRDLFTAPVPAHYGGGMRVRRDADDLLAVWAGTPVSNLMNENVISVAEDTPLMRAAELMVNTGKHPLPVLDEGRLVGAISRADVVRGLLAARQERDSEST
jgi:CBS domain-containing protein